MEIDERHRYCVRIGLARLLLNGLLWQRTRRNGSRLVYFTQGLLWVSVLGRERDVLVLLKFKARRYITDEDEGNQQPCQLCSQWRIAREPPRKVTVARFKKVESWREKLELSRPHMGRTGKLKNPLKSFHLHSKNIKIPTQVRPCIEKNTFPKQNLGVKELHLSLATPNRL